MSGRPFALAATLVRSVWERDQKLVRSRMPLEQLERNDSAVGERHGFVRYRDARRDIGVEEGIEERIADKDERAVMETVDVVRADESKADTDATVNAGAIRIRITVWITRGVGHVDPSLAWSPAHVANDFVFRRTPRQPHRVRRHADADLSLTDQLLVGRPKGLINFRMTGDARFNCGTAGENQSAAGQSDHQCRGENSTFHRKNHSA